MTKVYKLGGDVGKSAERMGKAIDLIGKDSEYKALVCSARGGVTDYIRDEIIGGAVSVEDGKRELLNSHLGLASQRGIPETAVRKGLEEALECLDNKNSAIREATGERLMLVIYEADFNMHGIPVKGTTSYNLGIVVKEGMILDDISMGAGVRGRIDNGFFDNKLFPLVTGYDGVLFDTGEATVLNRNGSDQTATFLGRVLGAREVYLLKNQKGVETSDPKLVSGTRNIPVLSYEMAMESGNIQLEAIRFVKEREIPLIVQDVNDPDTKTVINGNFESKGIELISGEKNCLYFEVKDIRDRPGSEEEILSLFRKYEINKIRSFGETGHTVSYALEKNPDNPEDFESFEKVERELKGHSVVKRPSSVVTVVGNLNWENTRRFEDIVSEVCEPLTKASWSRGIIASSMAVPREAYREIVRKLHEEFIEKP